MEMLLLGLILGFALGFFIMYQLKKEQVKSAKILADELASERISRIKLETELETERKTSQEKLLIIEKAEESLRNAFKALSSEALESNTSQFLKLAKTSLEKFHTEAKGDLEQKKQSIDSLVKPLAESLEKYDRQLREIEKKSSEEYGTVTEQVRSLKEETVKLVNALSKPYIRGYWGEMQLRNIVEYAGMLEYCDFVVQESTFTDEGILRPDMIIRVPGGLKIVVDAKTPMNAYQESVNTNDESERKSLLEAHAKNVKNHINDLSSKEYWKQFSPSPDFVVMFIPGEPFYLAALQQDPSLLSLGVQKRVILASPTTLIALLRLASFGWRQEQLAENAKIISELGKEIYSRIAVLAGHLGSLGKNIKNSVESYNKLVGTLESRVLVSARKFSDLGVETHKEIKEMEPLETQTRELQAPEIKDE